MDNHLVEFSQLTHEDLKRLALLHHSVMHTLLSDLGLPIVWRYYQIAQRDSRTIGLCAISDSGQIQGWAMGSPHPDRINAQLRSPLREGFDDPEACCFIQRDRRQVFFFYA